MRVLQICPKPPLPLVDGGCIAIYNFSENLLKAGHELHILSCSTYKHPFIPSAYSPDFLENTHFESHEIDIRKHPKDLMNTLFSSRNYHVERFYDRKVEQRLIELLTVHRFDVIQLETIHMAVYLPAIKAHSDARLVYRSHNIEHHLVEQNALRAKNPLKKWYLKDEARKFRNFEWDAIPEFDGVACISEGDYQKMFNALAGNLPPAKVIPFGLNAIPKQEISVNGSPLSYFHIGAMDWVPNIEGMMWFLNKVWKPLVRKYKHLQFELAGKDISLVPPPAVRNHVNIHKNVEDAKAFMSAHQVMIVPVFAGSGIRIKVIEGLALGKIILTTSKGAEGIPCKDREHLLIANTPDEFISKIEDLEEGRIDVEQMRQNAMSFVSTHFNNERISAEIGNWYQELSNHQ